VEKQQGFIGHLMGFSWDLLGLWRAKAYKCVRKPLYHHPPTRISKPTRYRPYGDSVTACQSVWWIYVEHIRVYYLLLLCSIPYPASSALAWCAHCGCILKTLSRRIAGRVPYSRPRQSGGALLLLGTSENQVLYMCSQSRRSFQYIVYTQSKHLYISTLSTLGTVNARVDDNGSGKHSGESINKTRFLANA
jgi:hypothetical protein